MKTIQVYDKPMCCSTGVCGPDVDPVLPQFAADLQWMQSQGHRVERFNLAQQPSAFLENDQVHQLLATWGVTCLPLIVIDGRVVSRQLYPGRDQLVAWTASDATTDCCGGPATEVAHACCAADEPARQTVEGCCDRQETGCC